MKYCEYFLMLVTYSALVINLIGVITITGNEELTQINIIYSDNESKSIIRNLYSIITFNFSEIDYSTFFKLYLFITKYVYFITGHFYVVSLIKTITKTPGLITAKNQIACLNFYVSLRIDSIKRGSTMNKLNNKFFAPPKNEILDQEESEMLSDDTDYSEDSFDYSTRGSSEFPEKEFFDEIKKNFEIDFEIKKNCKLCKVKRIPYSEHCSSCKGCVINKDHHCPWIGNCIGIFNHKYFLLTIFYLILHFYCALVLQVLGTILNVTGSAG
jgi:hypothetical protein